MRKLISLKTHKLFAGFLALVLVAGMTSPAFAGNPEPINEHVFIWTDPESGGQIEVTERVFLGCFSDGHQGEYTFAYFVRNIDFQPITILNGGVTNGISGWQLHFNQAIPELHDQLSPAVGGPWMLNAFSGIDPPMGAEWDVRNSEGYGILPGETGVFSFCTAPREDIVVNDPPQNPLGMGPNGWAHSWIEDDQVFLFNGAISIPGDLLDNRKIGGTSIPVSTTTLLVAGFQANMGLWSLALVGIVGAGAAIIYKTKSKKTEQ